MGDIFTDQKCRFVVILVVIMTKSSGAKCMDDLDRNILGLLGADARMSMATLARRLKVARSTIQARLERLETTGVIAGYTLKLGESARAGPAACQRRC